jgi:hypothetical protein
VLKNEFYKIFKKCLEKGLEKDFEKEKKSERMLVLEKALKNWRIKAL